MSRCASTFSFLEIESFFSDVKYIFDSIHGCCSFDGSQGNLLKCCQIHKALELLAQRYLNFVLLHLECQVIFFPTLCEPKKNHPVLVYLLSNNFLHIINPLMYQIITWKPKIAFISRYTADRYIQFA